MVGAEDRGGVFEKQAEVGESLQVAGWHRRAHWWREPIRSAERARFANSEFSGF
jgi:hypothetical protein